MQNRNCKKCGKVFRYITGYPLCDECKVIDEDEFLKVREHIKLNPGINIEEVAQVLELNPRQILRYLREERLEVSGNTEKLIFCELCGAPIRTGRFCENCKREVDKELGRTSPITLGDTYYYNDEEEKKIDKLKYKERNK